MGMRIPPLTIKTLLESNPLKSIILVLVWRLAVNTDTNALHNTDVILDWALLPKGQEGVGQSGQSRVIQPSATATCYWPGQVWGRAKGQTQVLEAEPSNALHNNDVILKHTR